MSCRAGACHNRRRHDQIRVTARVAKLADALDLGSSAERRAGSTPASRNALRPPSGLGIGPRFRRVVTLVVDVGHHRPRWPDGRECLDGPRSRP